MASGDKSSTPSSVRSQQLPDLGQSHSAQPDQPVDSKTPVQDPVPAADVPGLTHLRIVGAWGCSSVFVDLTFGALSLSLDLTPDQARAIGNELFTAAREAEGVEDSGDVQAGEVSP